MATCQEDCRAAAPRGDAGVNPAVGPARLALAFAVALALVAATRLPVARTGPVESDEFGFLETVARFRLPMHHTLFLAAGRVLGDALGDRYRGFVALDVLVSAGALAAVWWWLRALVRPATAVAGALALAAGPVFWAYGAIAGNYTMIPLVGAALLGLAARTWDDPRPWHPYVAAAVLAAGVGYRQDLGTFWLPVLLLLLTRHPWKHRFGALALFGLLNLAWLVPMLVDVGGWARYRAASAEFSREAGYKNSVWYLGVVDGPVRYVVKLGMAVLATLGPALVFAPWGVASLWRSGRRGAWLAAAMLLAALPALAFHLLIHFGVPGYALHYAPALLALAALGAEAAPGFGFAAVTGPRRAPMRLLAAGAVAAAVFLFYPTDFERPGIRGQFDLAFARYTRAGLKAPLPDSGPTVWRTRNSRTAARGRGMADAR